jgi:acyl-coenzyme A thioesterase PaaI-like protein
MRYTPAALRLLGYSLRGRHWNDFATHTMETWYKFSSDHSVSNFAWYSTEQHRNVMNVTHGGALVTYMDYAMAATIWDLTAGGNAWTISLNNEFVRPARTNRWLFAEVQIVSNNESIELEGTIRANNPNGMLVMRSFGKFTRPKNIDTENSSAIIAYRE